MAEFNVGDYVEITGNVCKDFNDSNYYNVGDRGTITRIDNNPDGPIRHNVKFDYGEYNRNFSGEWYVTEENMKLYVDSKGQTREELLLSKFAKYL